MNVLLYKKALCTYICMRDDKHESVMIVMLDKYQLLFIILVKKNGQILSRLSCVRDEESMGVDGFLLTRRRGRVIFLSWYNLSLNGLSVWVRNSAGDEGCKDGFDCSLPSACSYLVHYGRLDRE